MYRIQNFTKNTCYNFFCKKNFCKIKISKSYLKSIYITKILTGLFILAIENLMLEKPKFKDLNNNFASQRSINFK